MPGANTPSVAEGTVLLMLTALRRLPALDRDVRKGAVVDDQAALSGRGRCRLPPDARRAAPGSSGNPSRQPTARLLAWKVLGPKGARKQRKATNADRDNS